jgi:hypothetical protein
LELLYRTQDITVDAIARKVILCNGQKLYTGAPQQISEVLCLGYIASAEAVAIPNDHRFEVTRSGISNHLLKSSPLFSTGSAYRVIDILANDYITVLARIGAYFFTLVINALLLFVRGASKVRNRRCPSVCYHFYLLI